MTEKLKYEDQYYEELEKCPFCGSGAVSIAILFEDTGNLFYGTCIACDASSKACETEQEATEEWNTRAALQAALGGE